MKEQFLRTAMLIGEEAVERLNSCHAALFGVGGVGGFAAEALARAGVGHFDLIAKHSDSIKFFDEASKEYKSAAVEAAEALSGKIPFFEVNTGAIARGYRKNPYPSMFLLKELKRLGFGAVISSDCHDKRMLDCAFDDASELLKAAGFNERYILTEQGFKAIAL